MIITWLQNISHYFINGAIGIGSVVIVLSLLFAPEKLEHENLKRHVKITRVAIYMLIFMLVFRDLLLFTEKQKVEQSLAVEKQRHEDTLTVISKRYVNLLAEIGKDSIEAEKKLMMMKTLWATQESMQKYLTSHREFDKELENRIPYCLQYLCQEINRCQAVIDSIKVNDHIIDSLTGISLSEKAILQQHSEITQKSIFNTRQSLLIVANQLCYILNRAAEIDIQNAQKILNSNRSSITWLQTQIKE